MKRFRVHYDMHMGRSVIEAHVHFATLEEALEYARGADDYGCDNVRVFRWDMGELSEIDRLLDNATKEG